MNVGAFHIPSYSSVKYDLFGVIVEAFYFLAWHVLKVGLEVGTFCDVRFNNVFVER